MSDDTNSSSNNSSGEPKKPEDSATPSMPSMPDVSLDSLQSSLKQGIHQGVKVGVSGINAALGQLQHTSDAIRKPLTGTMEHASTLSTQCATEARIAYERRHEFGPYYVAGSTLAVGGITALRRGRLPGLLLGATAGAITYVALYEPLTDSPDFALPKVEWPFQNLTGSLPGMGGSSGKSGSSGGDSKKE